RVRRLTRQVLDERAGRALTSGVQVLEAQVEDAILRRVVARVCGLGPLEGLLENPEIENLNLTETTVWGRYADGTRANLRPIVASPEELVALVRRIAADSPAGERRFDAAAPILDMPLTDGSRLNAILDVSHQPAVSIRRHRYRTTGLGELRRLGALDTLLDKLLTAAVRPSRHRTQHVSHHPAVSIRRHRYRSSGLGELRRLGTLVTLLDKLLTAAVRARRNIVISGGTGAGKTTLLRALAAQVPPEERVVTIEDVPELALERDVEAHPDTVALHARPPNTEGRGEITVADLVRAALRMSPDRVIVGETRGS